MSRIALIGDYNPAVTAHQAIPLALKLAATTVNSPVAWEWIGTERIGDAAGTLAGFQGVWLAPASPYRNMDGALAAVRYARENQRPFLGTCGGFQHALIEFARNVAGIAAADHAETAPGNSAALVISPLSCSLVEKSDRIAFTPGSRLHAIFGGQPTHESYHCNYGPNPEFRPQFEAVGFRFTGFDDAGEIRAGELPRHPFFIGTLFQPERSALRNARHPLIAAFVSAVTLGKA